MGKYKEKKKKEAAEKEANLKAGTVEGMIAVHNPEKTCNIDTIYKGKVYKLKPKTTLLFETEVAKFLMEAYPFLLRYKASENQKDMEVAETSNAPVNRKIKPVDTFSPRNILPTEDDII